MSVLVIAVGLAASSLLKIADLKAPADRSEQAERLADLAAAIADEDQDRFTKMLRAGAVLEVDAAPLKELKLADLRTILSECDPLGFTSHPKNRNEINIIWRCGVSHRLTEFVFDREKIATIKVVMNQPVYAPPAPPPPPTTEQVRQASLRTAAGKLVRDHLQTLGAGDELAKAGLYEWASKIRVHQSGAASRNLNEFYTAKMIADGRSVSFSRCYTRELESAEEIIVRCQLLTAMPTGEQHVDHVGFVVAEGEIRRVELQPELGDTTQ